VRLRSLARCIFYSLTRQNAAQRAPGNQVTTYGCPLHVVGLRCHDCFLFADNPDGMAPPLVHFSDPGIQRESEVINVASQEKMRWR